MRRAWLAMLFGAIGCSGYLDGELVVDEMRATRAGALIVVGIDVRNAGRSAIWVHASPHRQLAELEDDRVVVALHPEMPGSFLADFTPLVEYRKLRSIGHTFGLDRTTLTLELPVHGKQLDDDANIVDVDFGSADAIFAEIGWYTDDPGEHDIDSAPEPDDVAIAEWHR